MNKIRIVSIALLAALALSVFAACGDDVSLDPPVGGAASTTAAEGAEPAETADPEIAEMEAALAAVPEADLGGRKFNILARAAVGTSEKEIWVESENGDVLNDAVYRRNSLVNEKFNTEVKLVTGDPNGGLKKSVLAGETTYDIAMPGISDASTLASGGVIMSFTSLPYNDLTKPWWELGTAQLNIAGKVFFMNSAVNYLADDVTYIMMFNKQLIKDYKMEEPYQLVRDGKWTIDVFTEMIQNISTDIDGDGQFTENDLYGFIGTSGYPNAFFYGSGLSYIEADNDTGLHLALDTEKATLVLEKVNAIYHGNNAAWISPGGQESVGMNIFMGNGGLFYGEVLSYIVNMRKMETDFGVLPVPKWNEQQENYHTYVATISSTMVIPMNCPDTAALSSVLEAMTIYSRQYVTPAYYDIALSGKFARDEESGEMLEIIRRHRVYDFGMAYSVIGISDVFSSLVNKNSSDLVSTYEKKSSKAQTQIDKITAKFSEME